MENIIVISTIGMLAGIFGTFVGGVIGVIIRNPSKKILSFILSLAAGLMIAVVCFELMPESFLMGGMSSVILGLLLGIISMVFCDFVVNKKVSKKYGKENLLKTGIVVSLGIALHNIPEGLAIGTGFDSSIKLGYSLALAIALHDIPEGISMSAPMKNGGMDKRKILMLVFISGATTGIGSIIGSMIGNISELIISISLSIAAGAMLYIVSGELTPEYNKLYSGKMSSIGNILGFILGFIVTKLG